MDDNSSTKPSLTERWKALRTRNKVIIIVVAAFVLMTAIGAAIGEEEPPDNKASDKTASQAKDTEKDSDKKSEPKPKASNKASEKPSKKSSDKPSEKPKKASDPKHVSKAKSVSKDLKTWADKDFWCKKPKPISNNENIYILACKRSDMAVVTATDKVYLGSWLDEMDDSLDKQGYMYVLDKGDALVTATNEGSVNRAWDLLGADGKRTKVGSLPFS